jgi:nitroreductase
MDKPATTNHPLHPILEKRWSPRAFSDKKVEKEKLQRLLEAARWSPSASNEQPWYFIVGEAGDDTFDKIFETLVEFNQLWVKTAPLVMLAIGKTDSNKSGNENLWFKYDVGQSVAHLTFQATHDGLWVHQMGGFNSQKAKALFDIPEGYEVVTAVAIGYMGDYKILHPNLQKPEVAKRERKSTDTFVFSNKFGEKSGLI